MRPEQDRSDHTNRERLTQVARNAAVRCGCPSRTLHAARTTSAVITRLGTRPSPSRGAD